MTPIFLISLPRAGSTLLQRILMSHPQVASLSEPWLMLPLVYMLKPEGMVSEYRHRDAYRAVQDFIRALPRAQQDYDEALRGFVETLYEKQCRHQERYFLDKTPRYYLIIEELARVFPEAKFIFLVRNPIQTMASMISTFSNNNLRNMHFYHVDLFKGIEKIANGIRHLGSQAITVKYEDIIDNQQPTLAAVFRYLELDWDPALAASLDDRGLQGSMGDQVGTYQYRKIEAQSTRKWEQILNERVRKNYVKRLLTALPIETLLAYGYDKAALLDTLKKLKTKTTMKSVMDLNHLVSSRLVKSFYLNLQRERIKKWAKHIILD